MGNFFVGIDIGCGSSKACIVDDQGKVIGYGFHEHLITSSKSTWSETDPDEYWTNIYTIIKNIIHSKNVDVSCIRAVSVSAAVPAMVMVDRNGNVINKAYNFLDTRSVGIVKEIKQKVDKQESFALSAYNIDEQSITTNLLWEKQNRPKDYARIYKILSPDAYVTFRLTGKMIVNYSIAAFYGIIFDIKNHRFDLTMCERIGVDPNLLPDLYPCEEIVGSVTEKASALTGIPKGVPVVAGTCDAYAGWLAGGATEKGDTRINLGTAAVLGVVLGKDPQFLEHVWNSIYPVNSRENYVLLCSTATGGYVMRYLRNNFSKYEMFVEKTSGYDAYDLMNLDAERIKPGCGGLITLPDFVGARTPEYNRDARGVVFGWRTNHTKGHLIRSMMEGVAFSTYRQLRTLEDKDIQINGPIIMNEGGGLKSRLWRRIYTDILGQPTAMLKNRTGAPYGNAILAGVSTGYLPDFSIAKQWAEYVNYMEPDEKVQHIYLDIYNLYNSIYEHLKEDYKQHAQLHNKYNWD